MKPLKATPAGLVHWVVRPDSPLAVALCGRAGRWSDIYQLADPVCPVCKERFDQMRKEVR